MSTTQQIKRMQKIVDQKRMLYDSFDAIGKEQNAFLLDQIALGEDEIEQFKQDAAEDDV